MKSATTVEPATTATESTAAKATRMTHAGEAMVALHADRRAAVMEPAERAVVRSRIPLEALTSEALTRCSAERALAAGT